MATPCNKRYAYVGLLCLLAMALAITPALGATPEKPNVQKISLLYALNAGSGTLAPKKGKGARYKLVLKGLDHNVTWFSDRPVRRTSSFPIAGLAKSWKGFGFDADPPNAALTYTDRSGNSGRTVIVELSHPRFAKGKLSFAARVLDPESVENPNLAEHVASADRNPAHGLTDASLFIDDTEAPVLSGCVLQPYASCPDLNLEFGDLAQVDLSNAYLFGARLSGSKLTEVDLSHADLRGVDFENAHLNKVNLEGANLSNGNFVFAELFDSNFKGFEWMPVYPNFEYASYNLVTWRWGECLGC